MHNYLLELGVEEFPAKYIESTKEQILSGTKAFLAENDYGFDTITVQSTPRRFALKISGIKSMTQGKLEEIKGPAKKIAYDEEGKASKALQGFMRSKGIDESDIHVKNINGVDYVYASIQSEVKPLDQVLKQGIPNMIRHISNPRAMRWGGKNLRFLRPIRWIVSILDNQVLYFDLDGIHVSNVTKGHRVLGQSHIVIDKIDDYEKLLEENYVIVDEKKRQQQIIRGLNRLSKEKGGDYIRDDELLDEVININEYPTPFIGRFDNEYLKLPKEVIVTPMKDHQRYFPVVNDEDELLPFFISVRNGDDKGLDNVIKGNEKVLVARLEDAKFFYELDLQVPVEENIEKLASIGYHEGLGNLKQKSDRLESLVRSIGDQLDISEEIIEHGVRAASLSKTDLVTKTVIEFTELQGTMGAIYALEDGENKIVAKAIEEQYLPRFANDKVAETTAGILLALADKVDSIAGLHSLGIHVTGSQDPYGQRRAALGILNTLIENRINLNLKKTFKDALFNYVEDFGQNFDYDTVVDELVNFISQRLRNKLIDEGHRYDVVDSVIFNGKLDVYDMVRRVKTVEAFLDKEDSDEILTRFVRIKNMSKDATDLEFDSGDLVEADQVVADLIPQLNELNQQHHLYIDRLDTMSQMTKIVDDYLDNTMINVEDEALKQARLGLLKKISDPVESIFDPTRIVRS